MPSNEFWKTYFTSSRKTVNELRKQYGDDSFKYEIRRIFIRKDQAIEWESKVLRRMKVLKNKHIWLNRTDNKAITNLGCRFKNETTSKRNSIEKLGNQYTKNTKWINNGIIKKLIPKDDEIPNGFVLGTGRTNKRPDLIIRNKTDIMRAASRRNISEYNYMCKLKDEVKV